MISTYLKRTFPGLCFAKAISYAHSEDQLPPPPSSLSRVIIILGLSKSRTRGKGMLAFAAPTVRRWAAHTGPPGACSACDWGLSSGMKTGC